MENNVFEKFMKERRRISRVVEIFEKEASLLYGFLRKLEKSQDISPEMREAAAKALKISDAEYRYVEMEKVILKESSIIREINEIEEL